MASRLISILLGVTLLGWVVFAYNWRSQLQRAQDELSTLRDERDTLRRQLVESENARKVAVVPAPEVPENDSRETRRMNRTVSAGDGSGGPADPWRGGGPSRFVALMDKPEIQRLIGIQQKAALDARFASLFHSLNLSPADLEKFKDLLVEKQTATMDALAAARSQGLTGPENRDAVRQAIASVQSEVDAAIRGTLGDSLYAQYQTYEQTLPERTVVTQLQQRLSYSSAPLTDAQSDQIIALLAANAPQPALGSGPMNTMFFPGAAPGFGAGPMRSGVPITDAVIAASQGILTSVQIAALTQLQQEQQAQARLAAEMSAARTKGPVMLNPGLPTPPPPR